MKEAADLRDRPWIVGEQNPYSTGQRYSLYPEPPQASGGRLMRILGMEFDEYLRTFNRWNLLTKADGPWSVRKARWAAFGVSVASHPQAVVLLGAKVAKAFGFEYEPFHVIAARFLILPHPSGLNRIWTDPQRTHDARECMKFVYNMAAFNAKMDARRAAEGFAT